MADSKHTKSEHDSMAWLKKMGEDARTVAEDKEVEAPRQMFLPGMEFMRAML